jgi:YVTN family beta-propeller protein
MRYGRFVLALLCAGAPQVTSAAQTPQASLLVLAKSEQSLFIVDPATLAVLGQVPAGPDPHEVIASADGRIAYISNYGGGSGSTITVVDLVEQKALPIIDLGALRGPHGLAFVGGKLWFTAEGAKVIGRYDPTTRTIDWVMGTGQDRTHMIYVFPAMDRIVTSNVSSGTMTVIDAGMDQRGGPVPGGPSPSRPSSAQGAPSGAWRPVDRTNWTETVIRVGHGSEGFDVSPDGKEIWAANAEDGTISVIDVASKTVTQTLDANVRGANRLKFTLDGKRVFVSSLRGPDLAVFDARTRKEVKRVRIGQGAAGILMPPDGLRAFVACTPDDYVAVIDVQTLEVTGKITAGKQPDGLAWALRK